MRFFCNASCSHRVLSSVADVIMSASFEVCHLSMCSMSESTKADCAFDAP